MRSNRGSSALVGRNALHRFIHALESGEPFKPPPKSINPPFLETAANAIRCWCWNLRDAAYLEESDFVLLDKIMFRFPDVIAWLESENEEDAASQFESLVDGTTSVIGMWKNTSLDPDTTFEKKRIAAEQLVVYMRAEIECYVKFLIVPWERPRDDTIPVLLCGRDDGPIVAGKEKCKLTNPQYAVVKALLDAGEDRLTKDELERKSGKGDARKILIRLVYPMGDGAQRGEPDPDWSKVVVLPGKTGGGYGIRTSL